MKSKFIKGIVSAALLGGAVSAFAGPGLADGAAKFVGNITTRGAVRSDFTQLWNQITAENECKWASIEGTRGNYNWRGCDAAYNWAKQNGGHFKFHALVWGSQYPNWLNGLSAADTKTAITNWMDAVAKHYPDLEMIDVVNEAIKSGGKYHSNYGSQGNNNIIAALGGDNGNYEFVAEAFRMARKRWPNAILIYNDYTTVQWQKNEGIDLIQKLKKAGAPVDAYGLQAHDMQVSGGQAGGQGGGGSCLNINTLKSTIEEIWNKTQIPLFISEYDIASNDDNDQKNCYSQQISYFMENEHIAGITIWGYLYGATWTSGGNSGIIRESNGRVTDRPAMTWLKDYLSKNKGVNTTGLPTGELTQVDPEPQLPFKGEAIAIPGKVEAEDFDIPGKGKNEDGTSNQSYYDADAENHGNSDYRKDTGVDLYDKATGVVVGYNNEGDWLEYTVDVKEAGDYTLFAAVASANATSGFTMSMDGKEIASFSVPKNDGEENYDDYNKVKTNVSLTAGKHILRMDVTGAWFDVDYFTFVKGKDATDPEPIGTDPGTSGIAQQVKFEVPTLGAYDVFDMNGVRLGRMRAYTMDEAMNTLQNTSDIKVQGIYMLRSVKNGAVKTVRVVR
jgi:GH35 family endo-1,4-beta-xylanase